MNEEVTVADSESLAYVLKRETLSSHRCVEKYLSKILFDEHLNRRKYGQVLIAMQSAYMLMESAARQYDFTYKLMLDRSKLAWLETDINSLQLDHYLPDLQKSHQVTQNEAETLGALYVMEGATLGGSYIFNKLMRHDWLGQDKGISFFYNYGSERGAKWRSFQTMLLKYDSNKPGARKLIISGANKAFNLVHSSLRDTTEHD